MLILVRCRAIASCSAELSKGEAALSVLWVHQSTCQEEHGLAGPAQPARVQAGGGGELDVLTILRASADDNRVNASMGHGEGSCFYHVVFDATRVPCSHGPGCLFPPRHALRSSAFRVAHQAASRCHVWVDASRSSRSMICLTEGRSSTSAGTEGMMGVGVGVCVCVRF